MSKMQIAFGATVMLAALFSLAAIGLQKNIDVAYLFTDPASLNNFPVHFGIFSNIGVLFWTATAGICLFASTISTIAARYRHFLMASGLLTLILMLDDQFLLHEEVLPNMLSISGMVLYGLYGTILAAIVILYHRLILGFVPVLFVFSLCCFGLSLISGRLLDITNLNIAPLLLEDGSKFLGILSWFLYFLFFSQQASNDHSLPDR